MLSDWTVIYGSLSRQANIQSANQTANKKRLKQSRNKTYRISDKHRGLLPLHARVLLLLCRLRVDVPDRRLVTRVLLAGRPMVGWHVPRRRRGWRTRISLPHCCSHGRGRRAASSDGQVGEVDRRLAASRRAADTLIGRPGVDIDG
jgi:hypothetical protein